MDVGGGHISKLNSHFRKGSTKDSTEMMLFVEIIYNVLHAIGLQ